MVFRSGLPQPNSSIYLIYPCGKAWNRPPFPSRFIVSDRVLAVEGSLRRFAPCFALPSLA